MIMREIETPVTIEETEKLNAEQPRMDEAEIRRQMYERMARGSAIEDAEHSIHRKRTGEK